MPRTRNPFPSNAVATTSSLVGLPNLRTRYAVYAEHKVDGYLEDFEATTSLAYLVLGIRGRYGTGKTHLVRHLMDYVASAATATTEGQSWRPIASKRLYVKADRPDLFDLYCNHIAGQLTENDLRELVACHYRKLLDERARATTPPRSERGTTTQIASRVVAEQSAEDPEYILELLRRNLLPVGDLSLQFDRELQGTVKSPREDFLKAYAKLAREGDVAAKAIRWIRGGELTPHEAGQVGVTARRIEATQARDALTFLLTAYRRAGMAFVFCLDEFERFRLTPERAGGPDAAGTREAVRSTLKDLAETFKECGQILLVSGIVEAWDRLPPDVFDRITRDNIIDVRLTPDEAKDLLHEYCSASKTSLAKTFEPGALERLLEVGEYNARRLLQVSHHAFTFAEPYNRPIASRDIPEAAAKALGDRQRLTAVQDAIRSVAAELHVTARADVVVAGKPYAFALGDASLPLALVEILGSFFKLEEVEDARLVAEATAGTVAANPGTRTCVIIVGYSSADVRRQLARAVDKLIVFDEDRFAAEFREFVRAAPDGADGAPAQPRAYDSAEFDRIARESRTEVDRLQRSIADASARSEAQKETERGERVSNKLAALLAEQDESLQAEDDFVTGLAPTPGASPDKVPDEARQRLRTLLNEQDQRLRRAGRLNEGQPRERGFARLLDSFAEDVRALQQRVPGPELTIDSWRQSFRSRRQLLRRLRSMQDVRVRIAGPGRWSFVRQLLWLSPWMRASLAGGVAIVLVTLLTLLAAWPAQRSANRAYGKALSDIFYEATAPGADDNPKLADVIRVKVERATLEFAFASPSGSPAVRAVRNIVARESNALFGIRSAQYYVFQMTLTSFVLDSLVDDPWILLSFSLGLVLIAVPLISLFLSRH